MRTRPISARSADIKRAQRRFERWRRRKSSGSRIPADLWREAVNLARDIGVSKTTQHLRLDYYALKRRLEAAPRRVSEEGGASGFVEIPVSAAHNSATCVLEVQGSGDVQLRMELQGVGPAELGGLVRCVLGVTE